MEVMDACQHGRFVHMANGYYIIDRNNKDVIIGFDGVKSPAAVHQEGRTAMDTYYNIRAMIMSMPVGESYQTTHDKNHTNKWIEEAHNNGRILFTNGGYTVIFNGQSVMFIHSDGPVGAPNGYVTVETRSKMGSWKYLQHMGLHTMAKELQTFSW